MATSNSGPGLTKTGAAKTGASPDPTKISAKAKPAAVKKAPVAKKLAASSPKPVVYIGPNMGGDLPMTQFTVYRGGLPGPIKGRVDADKDFSRLFVSVTDLPAARAELKNKKSVRGLAYAAVMTARRK